MDTCNIIKLFENWVENSVFIFLQKNLKLIKKHAIVQKIMCATRAKVFFTLD